ncbi:26S proteasome non-ATPase regulatory subunit 8 [Condylostylus longicornis]|uniref:26S proteasome non-ATPase regulatory subunit 8 n=1 Tax=Condylostylus longicornis TaxID=2530218 RepID=UPI00244E3024|nr:26S proteasome non-ATPase regulatory subunit 8 [Condylostylus longicornis]
MADIKCLYQDIKTEWNKTTPNLKKCEPLINDLKIALTKLSYLPTGELTTLSKDEMILSRNILEIAVEYSVASKDIPAFERYMAQLKCHYYDYKNIIGGSENMYKLLGLNLLFLLSGNRVSDFHIELELLPAEVIQTNEFIRPILALEQYIMEGRYNKIFEAKNGTHPEIYNFFMDLLLETVRDEIGACIEKSYDKISIKEAAKRLNLKSKDAVRAFGAKKKWHLESDEVFYFSTNVTKPKEPLPSTELAEQVIFYARELEMIV